MAGDEDNPMSDVFTFNDGNEKITLRYDLSSPLSRFVAQNYRDLPFPYKRYAIGNVWRNEKVEMQDIVSLHRQILILLGT